MRAVRASGDDGRITVLVVGYFVVVALLVSVVGGIAAVQTARQRLVALADGAAVEASQAVDEQTYYRAGLVPAGEGGGGVQALPLTDAGVRAAAEQNLVAARADERFPTLVLGPATGSPDGATAQVELSAVVAVPMLPASIGDVVGGVPITVLSRARAPLG